MPEDKPLPEVRPLWEKRTDESATAFAAFKAFRDLGLTRTVADAYRQKTGRKKSRVASGTFYKWAREHEWFTRAEAFDRYCEAIERRAEEKAFEETRREWIKRRSDIQASAYQLGELLDARAREILAMPLTRTTTTEKKSEDGRILEVVTVTEPLRATMGDAIRAAEMSDKLKRLAAGMATERVVTKSARAEAAELIEDARHAFREARDLYRATETVETTARNIAAAYALEDVNLLLEGYDDSAPPAPEVSSANN